MDANIENLIQQHLSVSPSTIGEKMAAGLSTLYLPPLPPAVDPVSPRRPWQRGNRPVVGVSQPVNRKPLRNTLGQEIALATALYEPSINFESRTGFDLRRIVEDQVSSDASDIYLEINLIQFSTFRQSRHVLILDKM